MGFMRDEFDWGRNKAAWSFGGLALLMGLPTVFFYNQGVFDEYDYWAGTVSLVVFALLETIVFSWIFGIDKGWREINEGADIKIPNIYKFIIKYITPTLLLIVFLGALFTPLNNDWSGNLHALFTGNGWTLDNSSIINQLAFTGLNQEIAATTDAATLDKLHDKKFFISFARFMLLGLFLFISVIVYLAFLKRRKEGRATL
jgi:hypothetical protein